MREKGNFIQSVGGKLAIAFLFVLTLSLSLWLVNRQAFHRMNDVVERLTEPDSRQDSLIALRDRMVVLNDMYRQEALSGRRDISDEFSEELKEIYARLDKLTDAFQNQPEQLDRLLKIDSLFRIREKLFERYLKTRYSYIHNGIVDRQFEALAEEVEKNKLKIDSNIVTTTTRTKTLTYDYTLPELEEEKKGLFKRKKKTEEKIEEPKVLVEEYTEVQVDTLSTTHQRDSILETIRVSFEEAEKERMFNLNYLNKQEHLLITSNETVYGGLMQLLDDVKRQNESLMAEDRKESIEIARDTIGFNRGLMMLFTILTFLLITLVIRDIFRMNSYRKELEEAKKRADFHSEAKQRFLANMSHEIRSPLQSIIGFSELVMKERPEEHTKAIYQSSKHLLQVVNEVLDYSRIISNRLVIEEKEINPEQIITELDDWMRLQCEQKGIKWRCTYKNEHEKKGILSDPFRLRQILINLLSNALKFTEKGEIGLDVTIKKTGPGSAKLLLQVYDTGVGMKPDDKDRIFNQFEQLDNASVHSGTGLGLSIVSQLVRQMKGKVEVESEPGEGSCFSIELYVRVAELIDVPEEKVKNEITDSDLEVWVIDDDSFILNLCRKLLENRVGRARFFSSPEDILQTLTTAHPDVILADIRMPGMSGVELCRIIRERTDQVRLVALTAQVLPEEKDIVLRGGFDAIVLKPFTADELYAVLENRDHNTEKFELSALREMLSSEEELEQVIQQFHEDTRQDLNGLETALSQKKREDILLLVHRLAGRCAQMGLKELAGKFRVLEAEEKYLTDEQLKHRVMALKELTFQIMKVN